MIHSFFSFIFLLCVIALTLVPVLLVVYGFYLFYSGQFLIGIIILATGALMCRIAKPISVLTGKDFKIF
jgi:hypothetical protein